MPHSLELRLENANATVSVLHLSPWILQTSYQLYYTLPKMKASAILLAMLSTLAMAQYLEADPNNCAAVGEGCEAKNCCKGLCQAVSADLL